MKRLAWLLLAVILSLSVTGFSAPPSSPDSGAAALSAEAIPGYNIECHNIRSLRVCASVSESRVWPGSIVTIHGLIKERGVGVPGQILWVVWSSNVTATCIGITDETGLASCTTYVPASTPGAKKVIVRVWIDHYKLLTHFRTRAPHDDEESLD